MVFWYQFVVKKLKATIFLFKNYWRIGTNGYSKNQNNYQTLRFLTSHHYLVLSLLLMTFGGLVFFTYMIIVGHNLGVFMQNILVYGWSNNPISFDNSWHTLLNGGFYWHMINMGVINCCDLFFPKFHWVIVQISLKFVWLC
jgi:hypothetical protein